MRNLEDYFKERSIEIVDTPTLSSDGSGTIVESDFQKAIGETELKEHLSKKVFYKNDMAISNDVESISAIHILRQGKTFKKIEKCKALALGPLASHLISPAIFIISQAKAFIVP